MAKAKGNTTTQQTAVIATLKGTAMDAAKLAEAFNGINTLVGAMDKAEEAKGSLWVAVSQAFRNGLGDFEVYAACGFDRESAFPSENAVRKHSPFGATLYQYVHHICKGVEKGIACTDAAGDSLQWNAFRKLVNGSAKRGAQGPRVEKQEGAETLETPTVKGDQVTLRNDKGEVTVAAVQEVMAALESDPGLRSMFEGNIRAINQLIVAAEMQSRAKVAAK